MTSLWQIENTAEAENDNNLLYPSYNYTLTMTVSKNG